MSDSKVTPADVAAKAAGSAPAGTEPAGENPTGEAAAQEPDWRAKYEATLAESRKWETRSKENAEAAKRLAEIEEEQKTEAEKAAERLAELEAENNQFKAEKQVAAWKAEVSEETGVPAAALAGDSLEALQAHAEVLKPLITKQAEQTTSGVVPGVGKQPERPASIPLDDQIAAAEKSGNTALVASLKAMKLGSATT